MLIANFASRRNMRCREEGNRENTDQVWKSQKCTNSRHAISNASDFRYSGAIINPDLTYLKCVQKEENAVLNEDNLLFE